MIIFRFILFFIFIFQGVDIFLLFIVFYFLYEIFVGFNLGFLGSIFFCGGWGYVLCLLRVIIVILIYLRGRALKVFNKRYIFLLWIIFISLIFCFKVNDFFLFYFRFEFVVVPIFLIMLIFGYSIDRVLASLYIFLYTLFTSLPFLLFLLYNEVCIGSLNLLYQELIGKLEVFYGWWVLRMLFVFIVKYPIYILHLWLPRAHVEAPVSGSMILAGVLLKLGAYGVLNLLIFRGGLIVYLKILLRGLSFIGVVLVCFLRVRQLDIKLMVAYSSIVHMGPVLMSFLYGFEFGLISGNFMLLAHGLCSSALFYILNLGYERQHSRRLFVIRGGLILSPVISYWWFFLCVRNIGCPPTFNFISEIFMMWGLAYVRYVFIFIICLLGFFVGIYCVYIYEYFNHGITLVISNFFVLRHLENNVIFIHSFPILVRVFFVGECI